MRKLVTFLTICILLHSCGISRVQPVQRDSTVVRYYDSLRIRDSVVMVSLPVESSSQVVFQGDTSHLETSLAASDAWVDSAGCLHHSLHNRSDERLPVIVPFIDRARGSEHAQQLVITETVEVEKPLHWWQKALMSGGVLLLCIIAAYFIFLRRR